MGDEEVHTRLAHRRVDLRGARYLGGHPQRPRAEPTRFLYLTAKGVEFRTGLTPVTVAWGTVRALVVAGPGELDGWVLLTDDLAPPTDAVSYLRVDAEIGNIAFELPGLGPDALRGVLEPVAHLVALPDVLATGDPPTPGESEDGVDSDDEAAADLDTRQMEALGLDGLIERPDDVEGSAAEDGDEPSDTAADNTVADAASADDTVAEAAVDAEPDAQSDVLEEIDVVAAVDAVDDVAEPAVEETPDLPAEPADADVETPAEAAVAPAVADEEQFSEDVAQDRAAQADLDTLELDASWDEAASSPVDDALEISDGDLELDELQLSALGIDPAHGATNGRSAASPVSDAVAPAEPQCPNGHTNPEGTRFCLECGAPMQGVGCPQGHANPLGASFCGECGANLRTGANVADATGLELREEAVRVALETLKRMQYAQQDEIAPLLRETGRVSALASDQRVLPLRKSLHEQHITAKRAELALAEARRDAGQVTGEEADTLIELRGAELDFSIQLLLEVTELIALPGNDEEGKELVRQHMGAIFSECDETRRSLQLRLACIRGEPHAIRAAELESDVVAKRAEVATKRRVRKPDPGELWRVEEDLLGLRVTQLSERRAAAIAGADMAGTDEAESLLALARDEAREHAQRAPVQVEKISRFEAEMLTTMATVISCGHRVPRSADRRIGAAKRAVAEFRDFFDTHPAPAIGVDEKLLDQLAAEWEEYNRLSRMVVGTTTVVPGRSTQRTRVQWIKYDQMVVNAWVRRISVVSAELEVSMAAGESERSDALAKLLDIVTEALTLTASAAKIEVPAV